jgi:hypothetical protein
MTAFEVGTKLVNLCKAGKNDEAIDTLYSTEIVSVEAGAPPGKSPEVRGIEAVRAKSKWWHDNHEVHSAQTLGPFPHGDRFAVYFKYELTMKMSGQRTTMEEVALYTIKGDKIMKEEFFYKGM